MAHSKKKENTMRN